MAARTIAVCNFKGGVGKTVISVNLAAGLANIIRKNKSPYRVLLIDADAQSNASCYMLGQEYWRTNIYPESKKSLYGVFKRNLNSKLSPLTQDDLLGGESSPVFRSHKNISWNNLYLLPSHYDLADFENDIQSNRGKLKLPGQSNAIFSYELLNMMLKNIKNDFDYIIIDCPPNLYHVSQNALFFAEDILVPVVPDWLSTAGLAWLLKSLATKFQKFGQKSKKVRGIIASLWDGNWRLHKKHKEQIINSLREDWKKDITIKKFIKGCELWNGLQRTAAIGKSVEECRPIIDYNTNNTSRIQIDKMVENILKW